MITDAAGFSEIGARPSNEDRYAFWWVGDAFFAAVADGLGGMGGGDYAAGYAVDHLRRRITGTGIAAGGLADLVLECHAGIRARQGQNRDRSAMATTLTVMSVTGQRLVAAHCGDTRLLLARDGEVAQLSEDHSQAGRLFREGRLSEDEVLRHPGKNLLESALGIPAVPVVQTIDVAVRANDWFLIASDGAYNRLDADDIVRIGRSSRTSSEFAAACRCLVEHRQPTDNFTVVVARADR